MDQLANLTHFNDHIKAKTCTKQCGQRSGRVRQLFCNSVDLCWTEVQSYQEICKLWSLFRSCQPTAATASK